MGKWCRKTKPLFSTRAFSHLHPEEAQIWCNKLSKIWQNKDSYIFSCKTWEKELKTERKIFIMNTDVCCG